ncbi:MAG: TauD/TfdA family dioxygenase [Gammaproteobacteria bacterium]|nr:TauD/TfdA family dioxygenase [Gammaproteobacteria bacterium]
MTEPSAWTAETVSADDSWIRVLTSSQAAELRSATEKVVALNCKPCEFDAELFSLPRYSAELAAVLEQLENGRGFVLLRGLPVEALDLDGLLLLYSGIGAHLGRVITQNSQGDRIGWVTDRGDDYASAGVRGHGSRAAIRPHCDSADVVGLLCVSTAVRGGKSIIASAMTIYNEILAHHPEYLGVLCRGFHINLAGKGPTGRADELSHHRIPVFSYFRGRLSCRFNQKQIEDAALIRGEPLTALEQEAIECVGSLALRSDIRFEMKFEPGDLQLLNNHCILHAREAYEDDPAGGQRRLLLRMWINLFQGRPLAPEFADRLNTGPRGEVAVVKTGTEAAG